MNIRRLAFPGLILLLLSSAASSMAAPPVVSNVRAVQRDGTKLVDITYDVADSDSPTVLVSVAVSGDGGLTYAVPAVTLSGDIGPAVVPGTDRKIIWNAGLDWPDRFTSQGRVRVTATDTAPADGELAGMSLIPAGGVLLGDSPVTSAVVSAFYIDRFEVSLQLWNQVLVWASGNGYQFDSVGAGQGGSHPVHSVNWYDAVKWCNARSEMESRPPVYFTDETHAIVYRTGRVDLVSSNVKWSARGYRLPTEAEWEKAARGGLVGHHFPWPSYNGKTSGEGAFIDGSKANFETSEHPFRSQAVPTTPVGYYNGKQTPAGDDMANGYGLYDMAGNVAEWCWDRYDPNFAPPQGNDPVGSDNRSESRARVRGGSWDSHATYTLRCGRRFDYEERYASETDVGFRTVISAR